MVSGLKITNRIRDIVKEEGTFTQNMFHCAVLHILSM